MRKEKSMNLDLFRREIDQIDRQIVALLKKRFDIVSKIGQLKKKQKTGITDRLREKEIRRKLQESALKLGVQNELVRNIFRIIISYAKKKQKMYE